VIEPFESELKLKSIKFSLPPEKKDVKMIDPDNVDELLELLINEAKVI
jgi:electron transfer flavoprotein beta subunit